MALDMSFARQEKVPPQEKAREPEVVEIPAGPQAVARVDPKSLLMAMINADKATIKAAIEAAKPAFAGYQRQMIEMVAAAEACKVVDEASMKEAINAASAIKKMIKALEEQRKEVIAAPDTFTRSLNAFVKTFRVRGEAAEQQYNRKAATYQAKVEAERREREAKARAEAEKLQKEIDAKAKAGGYEAPQVELPPERRDTTIRTEDGASAHMRKTWTFEVEDLAKVPPEYLQVDTLRVNMAIKAGLREIPGLRIYQESKMVFRG